MLIQQALLLTAEIPVGSLPSQPTNLINTSQSNNSMGLSWTASTPGAYPISHYRIYRNGTAYATSSTTTYTDTSATNANSPVSGGNPTLAIANTIYAYAVSAVDTQGNEGPSQANMGFWTYYNGTFNWGGDYSYANDGGTITINYASTAGAPEEGPYDISVTSVGSVASGFQPFSGKTTTQWDMEGGAFNYLSMDLKPTLSGQDWQIFQLSRLPPGDNAPWANVYLVAGGYGPTPVVGQWKTYKIPLAKLTIGFTNFTASISGTTMTVTSVASGVGLDAGGYVTGTGVPSGTYCIEFGTPGGGAGTYTVGGPGIPTTLSSRAMVYQRTGLYKFALVDRNSSSPANNVYYVDNVKFTVS